MNEGLWTWTVYQDFDLGRTFDLKVILTALGGYAGGRLVFESQATFQS